MSDFTMLQALDVTTTMIGLFLGLREGIWVPAALMGRTGPIAGLLICKLFAFGIVVLAVLLGRRVIVFNHLFCSVILWNCGLIFGRAALVF